MINKYKKSHKYIDYYNKIVDRIQRLCYDVVKLLKIKQTKKPKNLNKSNNTADRIFDGNSVTALNTLMTCICKARTFVLWLVSPMLRQMACSCLPGTSVPNFVTICRSNKVGYAEERYACRSYAPYGSGQYNSLQRQVVRGSHAQFFNL